MISEVGELATESKQIARCQRQCYHNEYECDFRLDFLNENDQGNLNNNDDNNCLDDYNRKVETRHWRQMCGTMMIGIFYPLNEHNGAGPLSNNKDFPYLFLM